MAVESIMKAASTSTHAHTIRDSRLPRSIKAISLQRRLRSDTALLQFSFNEDTFESSDNPVCPNGRHRLARFTNDHFVPNLPRQPFVVSDRRRENCDQRTTHRRSNMHKRSVRRNHGRSTPYQGNDVLKGSCSVERVNSSAVRRYPFNGTAPFEDMLALARRA